MRLHKHYRWCLCRREVNQVINTARSSSSSARLPSTYNAQYVHNQQWHSLWNDKAIYKYDPHLPPSYVVLLPPPNVTGQLHLGHALTVTIQDTLLRYHRKLGQRVAYIGGYDHAGIATQSVVERHLLHTKRVTRQHLDRDTFLQECQQWKDSRTKDIGEQLERLGASIDWNRQYYTMDKSFSTAVTEAFNRLHAEGLIFRDERLVNWCPQLNSTISDQEVDSLELDGETMVTLPAMDNDVRLGVMYDVIYHLVDNSKDSLVVSTTRPETMLADVALCVHPSDVRYNAYIGHRVQHPLLPAVTLPVIADTHVKPDIGTGVLKVTPGHDQNDWDIAQRHALPLNVSCLDAQANITSEYTQFAHMNRFKAREAIVSVLKQKGALKAQRSHAMNVPICSRTGDLIEPRLKSQWFLDCRSMSASVTESVRQGHIRLSPSFYESVLSEWCTKSTDWCLSRQLLWGHPIPAWECDSEWIVARDQESADGLRDQRGLQGPMQQDTDVLDTWFSSALVPLVVAGWPHSFEGPDHKGLYPSAMLETGNDILGFWVVRMIMLALKLTDRVPFTQVVLHGLLQDGRGKKMSKSKGNVIDPVHLIDGISLADMLQTVHNASALDQAQKEETASQLECDFPAGMSSNGVDSVRFGLLGHDFSDYTVNFAYWRVHEANKFCNKMWQAMTFCEKQWAQVPPCLDIKDLQSGGASLSSCDEWILASAAQLQSQVHMAVPVYKMSLATSELYTFFYSQFCDRYLEVCKHRPASAEQSSVLHIVFTAYIHCLAAFMPYLAEHLYHRLPTVTNKQSVMDTPFLDLSTFTNERVLSDMRILDNVLTCIRAVRQDLHMKQNTRLNVHLVGSNELIEAVAWGECVLEWLGALCVQHSAVDEHMHQHLYTVPLLHGTAHLMLPPETRTHCIERLKHQIQSKTLKMERETKKLNERLEKRVPNDNIKFAARHEAALKRTQNLINKIQMEIDNLSDILLKIK